MQNQSALNFQNIVSNIPDNNLLTSLYYFNLLPIVKNWFKSQKISILNDIKDLSEMQDTSKTRKTSP